MIPKRLFMVWLGGAPLPDAARAHLEGWHDLHPRWEVELLTAPRGPLVNAALYDAGPHDGLRSDVLRYEELAARGGVYVDVDMEPRRSLDPLIADCHAFCGRHLPTEARGVTVETNIAVLGCEPGHPLFTRLVERLDSPEARGGDQDGIARAGPLYFQRQLSAWMSVWTILHPDGPLPPVTLFEPSIFYPYRWFEPERAGGHFHDAYAVHRWWGTWHD